MQRRGKYLVIRLDGAEALVVHLGMSGQLLRAKSAREKAPKHSHVVITFTQGGLLRFVDPRTFGEMFVTKYDDLEEQVEELAHIGLDPLEVAMSWDLFGRMLAEKKARLKTLLMDQKFIAGIGNVYSDEILFNAGLKWDRMSDSLSQQEVRRLYRAISETLQDAVKYRGSSLSDMQYCDLFGRPGEYQQYHQVYDKEGKPCQRCRRPLRPRPVLEPLDVLLRGMPGVSRVRVCRITGRVQGVWFRDSCREAARANCVVGLGAKPWRRCGRSRVRGAATRSRAHGLVVPHRPPRARVDDVDVTVIPTVGAPGFRIR